MDAEKLLRLYLEQRRELGERDLILDEMSVEEVLRIVGANRTTSSDRQPAAGKRPATSGQVRATHDTAESSDWRSTLRATGAGAEATPPAASGANEVVESVAPPLREPPHIPAAPSTGTPLVVVRDAQRGRLDESLRAAATIEALAGLVRSCERCPLYRTALNPVPGEGSPQAGLMCVGEAPGATEDQLGRPFVGQAGQLLTKILAAVKLSREEVFIANVLKHRPPGNRNPNPEEVQACRPYLLRQIELVRPRVILALGTFAAQSLLETKLPIGRLRGTVHSFADTPVVVTYHPAALLRNPTWKRPTWEDVQLARRILDSPIA